MKTVLVRLLFGGMAVSCVSLLWGQTTPFGTPSLLPIHDHSAQWQTTRMALPPLGSSPTSEMTPPNRAELPLYGRAPYGRAPYGQASSLHRLPSTVPAQFAGDGMGMPAHGDMPLQAPSVRQPQSPRESIGPRSREMAPSFGNTGEYEDFGSRSDFGYGSNGEPCGELCDPCCEPCCEPCFPCFYASVGGLVFTRNRHRFRQVSYDDTDLVGQVLSTHSSMGRWDLGGMVTLGWYLNPCSGCALEVGYWGIYGSMVETTSYAANLPGNLNTAFDLRPLNIGATNVNDLYDAAQLHRIQRDYDIHNAEVNLVGGRFPGMMGPGIGLSYLAGFRYMRFTEDFFYASADAIPLFGADPANEGYYDIRVRNNLWGFQLGGRADWYATPRFSLYVAPKFGIYANYMEHHSRVYNATGPAVVGPGNPLVGGIFDIGSDKTIASFMGEIDLGLSYQFTHCLSAAIGYRAVAVSGLAYATDQIPNHFADLPGVAMIDSNADMILHGGYAAVTLTW